MVEPIFASAGLLIGFLAGRITSKATQLHKQLADEKTESATWRLLHRAADRRCKSQGKRIALLEAEKARRDAPFWLANIKRHEEAAAARRACIAEADPDFAESIQWFGAREAAE